MKRSLMDILCCPVCKGDLDAPCRQGGREGDSRRGTPLRCLPGGLSHPRRDPQSPSSRRAITGQGAGMNLPLPVTMLLSAGAGSGDGGYEIYLNRTGINSIDIPREKILAEPGAGLVLKFLNRGAPIHITITSANASMFTDFFHENMYIVDEAVLSIPIRKDCGEGSLISRLLQDMAR